MTIAAWYTNDLLVSGFVYGLVIGLLAMGIILIFRSTGVINFAVGSMGLPGASLMALMSINYGFPFWVAVVLALLVGGLFGGLIELAVIRRLFEAPRVILLVATIGIAELCVAIVTAYPDIESSDGSTAQFPAAIGHRWSNVTPIPGSDVFRIRSLNGPDLQVLIVVPLLALALSLWLNRTTVGKTVQAAADNPALARLSAISPRNVSRIVWIIAGAISTLSIMMLSSGSSPSGLITLGPSTMVRAMAAAVLAKMVSFPRAIVAGVVIGLSQSILQFNYAGDTPIDFLLFIAIVVAIFIQNRDAPPETGTFSFAPKIKPIPERIRGIWWVRSFTALAGLAALGAAIVIPLIVQLPSRHLLYSTILIFAICAISVVIITGWSGLLSLSQMAFAGIGALSAAALTRGVEMDIGWRENRLLDVEFPAIPFVISIVIGALVAALVAAAIGVGALRVRGLMLAVSTFAFAVACEQYIYKRPIFSNGQTSQVRFPRGRLGPIDLAVDQRNYYYFCLAVLVLVVIVAARLRRTGVGRSVIAVRDNADTAAAYTVSATGIKLRSFALAGGIAGLGGGLLAGLIDNVPISERFFQTSDSLRVVSIAVIGGLGSISGAILGSLWVMGLPAFFGGNELVPLFTSSIGLLILLLYFPGGLVQIGFAARDALFGWMDRRLGPAETTSTTTPPTMLRHGERADDGNADEVVLATIDLEVRFGGVVAVDLVSLCAHRHEIVGLIGTNGAGKSTTMNAIGGFVSSRGTVELNGVSLGHTSPAMRARRGLGRTFQAATLFPELTVRETVQVALEARHRVGFVSTALFLPRSSSAERAKVAEASELIDFLGLGRYADSYIADLSTGTRRIVELAGLLALDAQVLCLDEPTAGVAQRETEAFGPLIVNIRKELGATMLIIEHDMPLIMSISDRVYCLESGAIIAEGTPNEVRNDPTVVASYLGTDVRAIDRSDAPS
ncbi:MAG: ATP-binding cassette domain-containing protein [Acidobacteria bacterium]|nr:ATP-binding cassette domain-containing protein [Acidobacteriota bacterium]